MHLQGGDRDTSPAFALCQRGSNYTPCSLRLAFDFPVFLCPPRTLAAPAGSARGSRRPLAEELRRWRPPLRGGGDGGPRGGRPRTGAPRPVTESPPVGDNHHGQPLRPPGGTEPPGSACPLPEAGPESGAPRAAPSRLRRPHTPAGGAAAAIGAAVRAAGSGASLPASVRGSARGELMRPNPKL